MLKQCGAGAACRALLHCIPYLAHPHLIASVSVPAVPGGGAACLAPAETAPMKNREAPMGWLTPVGIDRYFDRGIARVDIGYSRRQEGRAPYPKTGIPEPSLSVRHCFEMISVL
jgi:hypothetical protein